MNTGLYLNVFGRSRALTKEYDSHFLHQNPQACIHLATVAMLFVDRPYDCQKAALAKGITNSLLNATVLLLSTAVVSSSPMSLNKQPRLFLCFIIDLS
jgi:hypothetical protein